MGYYSNGNISADISLQRKIPWYDKIRMVRIFQNTITPKILSSFAVGT